MTFSIMIAAMLTLLGSSPADKYAEAAAQAKAGKVRLIVFVGDAAKTAPRLIPYVSAMRVDVNPVPESKEWDQYRGIKGGCVLVGEWQGDRFVRVAWLPGDASLPLLQSWAEVGSTGPKTH